MRTSQVFLFYLTRDTQKRRISKKEVKRFVHRVVKVKRGDSILLKIKRIGISTCARDCAV